jgi:hypothetical protein
MSRFTSVLDDLAGGAHNLRCHQNEEQGIRVEDDGGTERAEKTGKCDAVASPA